MKMSVFNSDIVAELITPSIEKPFLDRYGLDLSYETWCDPHNRGIITKILQAFVALA